MGRHRVRQAMWRRLRVRPRPGNRSGVAVALIVVLVVASFGATAPAHALQPAQATITGDEFVRRISTTGVDAENLMISGDVDLRAVRRVDHLIACRNCTITGSLHAADVIFERVVDLSGLHLHGSLDAHGATFLDAFLLQRSRDRTPFIAGTTNLQVVTFAHQTAFDGIQFTGAFDARSMTVKGTASFVEARFIDSADLARTQFQSAANFSGATFFDVARFDRAHFGGPALVQESRFDGPVTFLRVRFDAGADYTLAVFREAASFDRATFGAATSFRFIRSDEQVSFDQTHVLRSMDFHTANLPSGISLNGVRTTGVLSLTGALIGQHRVLVGDDPVANPAATIGLEPAPTAGLLMDVADTAQIGGPRTQIKALEVLERTAADNGELSLANDARYRLLALSSQRHGLGQRVLDSVFYRSMAGYLVRPVHALWWLLAVVAVGSLIRAAVYWRLERRAQLDVTNSLGRSRHGWRSLRHMIPAAASSLAAGLSDAVRRAVTRTRLQERPVVPPMAARALAVEVVAYRVLIAVALIAIGNSSATVREVIDAIHG